MRVRTWIPTLTIYSSKHGYTTLSEYISKHRCKALTKYRYTALAMYMYVQTQVHSTHIGHIALSMHKSKHGYTAL